MPKPLTQIAQEAIQLLRKNHPDMRFVVFVSDGADVSAGSDLAPATAFPLVRGYMHMIEQGMHMHLEQQQAATSGPAQAPTAPPCAVCGSPKHDYPAWVYNENGTMRARLHVYKPAEVLQRPGATTAGTGKCTCDADSVGFACVVHGLGPRADVPAEPKCNVCGFSKDSHAFRLPHHDFEPEPGQRAEDKPFTSPHIRIGQLEAQTRTLAKENSALLKRAEAAEAAADHYKRRVSILLAAAERGDDPL